MTYLAPANPSRLLLTPEQRAEDALPDPIVEALAVHLYETDSESEFNDGDDVQWRDNHAHRDRYRGLAREALTFLTDGPAVTALTAVEQCPHFAGAPLDETVQALYARLSETRGYLRGSESSLLPQHDDCCPRHTKWLDARRTERDSLREREKNILTALQTLDPDTSR